MKTIASVKKLNESLSIVRNVGVKTDPLTIVNTALKNINFKKIKGLGTSIGQRESIISNFYHPTRIEVAVRCGIDETSEDLENWTTNATDREKIYALLNNIQQALPADKKPFEEELVKFRKYFDKSEGHIEAINAFINALEDKFLIFVPR